MFRLSANVPTILSLCSRVCSAYPPTVLPFCHKLSFPSLSILPICLFVAFLRASKGELLVGWYSLIITLDQILSTSWLTLDYFIFLSLDVLILINNWLERIKEWFAINHFSSHGSLIWVSQLDVSFSHTLNLSLPFQLCYNLTFTIYPYYSHFSPRKKNTGGSGCHLWETSLRPTRSSTSLRTRCNVCQLWDHSAILFWNNIARNFLSLPLVFEYQWKRHHSNDLLHQLLKNMTCSLCLFPLLWLLIDKLENQNPFFCFIVIFLHENHPSQIPFQHCSLIFAFQGNVM